jgi:hypothetical protein
MASLPGRTELAPQPTDKIIPFLGLAEIPPLLNRRVILIATATINTGNLFSNGLFQNIYLIYRICEALGWLPLFVVSEKPKNIEEIPQVLRNCRVASLDDIVKQPIPVGIYLEIGMSVDKGYRNYMKMLGARICKLYLGNILNIDVETPTFYFPMTFVHHSVGAHDEIWFSPHYQMHAQYGAALNHIEPGGGCQRIAPYIWDPAILTDDGRRKLQWQPRVGAEKQTVVIMEPNISFQKCSLIPLMIMEAYCRAHPDWNGEVLIVNGEKLLQSTYFLPSIYQHLQIVKQDKVRLSGRREIKDLMAEIPSLIAICHNVNNDYNYMTLEFLHTGFPLIHNSGSWSSYGYYYKDNDIAEGVKQVEAALTGHANVLETYKSHARALAWRHSLYNPDVQKGWKELLEVAG